MSKNMMSVLPKLNGVMRKFLDWALDGFHTSDPPPSLPELALKKQSDIVSLIENWIKADPARNRMYWIVAAYDVLKIIRESDAKESEEADFLTDYPS